MHQFYKKKLYKYLILNITNFYLFLLGKKKSFLELRLELGLGI